ncbi:UNVERIFIED_CONTAM: tRNA methyltransferase complex GCD14 subunit protein [Hammondia hammondi]|eukprot:XP_008884914.1 tRNA methyltransferase complex GCD14 subunit protein [Hammondia hammondi]
MGMIAGQRSSSAPSFAESQSPSDFVSSSRVDTLKKTEMKGESTSRDRGATTVDTDAGLRKTESSLSIVREQVDHREYPRYGDFVILYGSHQLVIPVLLERGRVSNSRLGNYRHDDIVTTAFGSKVQDRKSKRWLVVLRPSPDLFSLALTHRTQILYHSDISLVLMLLDACPGRRICEAGTGSGSLSCHLARAVAPTGHIFTFEFHRQRKMEAEADFKRLGLSSYLSCYHRDVCADGFVSVSTASGEGVSSNSSETSRVLPLEEEIKTAGALAASETSHDDGAAEKVDLPAAGSIDSLFLDVPSPWLALDHVDAALREGGRFVNFSPCIEQVQRVCECLHERGYHGIRTFEVIRKPWGVWTTKPTARSSAVRDLGRIPEEPILARDSKRLKKTDAETTAVSEDLTQTSTTTSRKGNGNTRRSEGDACQGDGNDNEIFLATFPLLISQLLGQSVPEEFWTSAMKLECASNSIEAGCEQGAAASKGMCKKVCHSKSTLRVQPCSTGTEAGTNETTEGVCVDRNKEKTRRTTVPIDFEATHYPLPLRGHTGYLTVAVKHRVRALSGKVSAPC